MQHRLDGFYFTFPLSNHEKLKNTLLTQIDESKQIENNKPKADDYYSESISKLDWSWSKDFSRPWVQTLKPFLDEAISAELTSHGYKESFIQDLWFQQYTTGDTHGWHIHGHTFTGVYYLDLPKDAPNTQIVNPTNQEEIIVPDVNEGDILMFPSYVIHRAPIIRTNENKTIISFNSTVNLITAPVLNKLK
mgnify:FL=1|jgi:hypothetical protein|tara:strand:- start:500 stop:1072 length:573 start_codon:yes stop_codon:yes gene_type:complete